MNKDSKKKNEGLTQNTKNKSKRIKKNLNKNKSKHGGKLINSGGFGCIFKPALKCKGKKTRKKNYVSKLANKKDIDDEYNNFRVIKKLLEEKPEIEKYFISNVYKCEPEKLSESDMKNLETCSILENSGLNKSNINKHLDRFEMLNIPYAGNDLWKLSDYNKLPEYSIVYNKLVNLLVNAIFPMNELNIFHLDIKANNILYSSKKKPLKLIDYGLVGISKKNKIPEVIMNRRIQFNTPFSCLVFNNIFMKELLIRFKNKNIKKDSKNIYNITTNTYLDFLNINNYYGHEGFIANVILPNLEMNVKKTINEPLTFYSVVCKFLTNILIKYLNFKNYTFYCEKYFNEIYSKNVDIYGWIMSYCIYLKDTKYPLKTINKRISNKISETIYKYCISPEYATKPIPYKQVIASLK
jgi:hypothetical protein